MEIASKKQISNTFSWTNSRKQVVSNRAKLAKVSKPKKVNPTSLVPIVSNRRKRELLWPGHNYMGPGNALENGSPVNVADQIAKQHDYAYAHAWNAKDIKQADADARAQFSEHLREPSALVGYVGLSVKSVAEYVFGSLYPNDTDFGQRIIDRSIMVTAGNRKNTDPWNGSH